MGCLLRILKLLDFPLSYKIFVISNQTQTGFCSLAAVKTQNMGLE